MTLDPIDPARHPGLSDALAAAGLPTSDLGLPGRVFFRMGRDDATLAYGGLELHGVDAILRSLVVLPAHRGQKHGRALVSALIEEAKARGVVQLWLLTIAAADFFANAGFRRAERGAAPAAIAASEEFASLCPASAVCMLLALKPR